MSRELDSITPNFRLTDEDIADLKRILTDDEYAEERYEAYKADVKKERERLKQMILTGVSDTGERLTDKELHELKEVYGMRTGERMILI